MKKINKIIVGITSLAIGLILINFAFSKIFGIPEVVEQFIEMAEPLNIDPTFFRLSTGILILIASLSYLVSGIIDLLKSKETLSLKLSQYKIAFLANGLGIVIMFGALLSEFFLRSEPKLPLVYLAIGIIAQSLINLKLMSKHVTLDSHFKLEKVNYGTSVA